MFNKIYELIKKNIKEITIYLIVILSTILIFSYDTNYYIDAPGGLIDVSERLIVEDGYDINGKLNLAYISEFKANVPALILSLFNKDWDVIKREEVILDNETIEENNIRNHLLLDEANQNAIMVAFDKANLKYEIKNKKVNIIFKDEKSDTDLKIGDQIISINGIAINNKKDVKEVFDNGNNFKIKVNNQGKEYERYANKVKFDNVDLIGIMICETKEVIPSKKVDIKFKKSESGPSGGFMMALSIYDTLIEEDLAKGRNIVGTGTIDENGYVGPIGGIKYKMKAAIKEHADLFFVPKDNYEEAKEAVEKEKLNINLVVVNHIDDAINYLKK